MRRLFNKTVVAKSLLLAVLLLSPAGCKTVHPQDNYGVYIARLDGSDLRMIMSSPTQEITHVRVSPDQRKITFTRYNHFGLDGTANENGGYDNTEIMLANIDGSGVETLTAPHEGSANGNSSWAPNGQQLIYCNFGQGRVPQDTTMDLKTRTVARVPTPPGLAVADPSWVKNKIVFTVIGKEGQVLWLMDEDGKNAHQITDPRFTGQIKKLAFKLGDYDPWLSPDATNVAFMRMMANGQWHSFVLNLATGKETDLSKDIPGVTLADGVPEWSSDGKLLILWHRPSR